MTSEFFEQAKQSVASELNEATMAWGFEKMLDELRTAIANKNPDQRGVTRNAIRYFCRHYLNMSGQKFENMRQWLAGTAIMPAETIAAVLRALQALANGTFSEPVATKHSQATKPAASPKARSPQRAALAAPPAQPAGSALGIKRKVLDLLISQLNSMLGLFAECGITPADVFDGDRMQIVSALQKICPRLGIKAIFSEPDATHNQPLTKEDLSEIGL